MTAKLLATLRQQQIPVVGFVNEGKLYKWGEVDERIRALNMWLDAGFELGNHTFGHTSLNKAGLKDFEESVVRGETVTRLLLAQHKMKLRYSRHPYLDVGRDVETRRDAEAFLVARGYRLAPVTMEILLLHANPLEADHIGELLEQLRKRGYRFITLEDALSDQAYGMPDTYVGEEGTGWLEHWAITRGRPPLGAPVFPPAIAQPSKALPPHPGSVFSTTRPWSRRTM